MTKHINTIVDYSLLWLLGVDYHNEGYGDRDFLELVYPKMVSLMGFCNGRREEHGFLNREKKKTGYILTGLDMDKDGPLCAEQMLYAACFRVMAEISEQLGEGRKCLQTGIRKTDGCY